MEIFHGFPQFNFTSPYHILYNHLAIQHHIPFGGDKSPLKKVKKKQKQTTTLNKSCVHQNNCILKMCYIKYISEKLDINA